MKENGVFDNIFVLAALIAVVGTVCGVALPMWAIAALSCIVAAIAAYKLATIDHIPGTSGGIGVVMAVTGGSVSFVVPMWVAWLIVN